MEENNSNNSNSTESSTESSNQSTPILSKRGQYNPNISQKQEVNNAPQQAFSTEQQSSTAYIPNQSSPEQQTYPNAYQNPYATNQPSAQKLKHSGVGIAGFVISLTAILAGILCVVFIFAGTFNFLNENETNTELLTDPTVVNEMLLNGELGSGMTLIIVGSLLMFAALGLAFIGVILGIVALIQKNRKKVFSILGVVFNGFILLGFVLLMLIGLANSF